MNENDRSRRFRRDSPLVAFVVAVIVTGVIFLEFWGGSFPELPGTAAVLLAVGGGIALAAIFVVLDLRFALQQYLDRMWIFLPLLVAGLVVGVALFPTGIPVSVEVGLLTLAWADVTIRWAVRFVGPEP